MSQKKNKDNQKKPSTAPLSQEEEALVQEILTNYQLITSALYATHNTSQVEEVLAPISELSEGAQMVLLMALSREKTTEAADVLLAINTFSPLKEVRKEARRSLIRMESFRRYPRWTPPSATVAVPALMPAEILQASPSEILAQLMTMIEEPDEVINNFLSNWLAEDYKEAYICLASTSPLREGLDEEAWVARREAWAALAHPTQSKFEIVYVDDNEFDDDEFDDDDDFEDEGTTVVSSVPPEEANVEDKDEDDEDDEEDESEEFEAFWSLALTNTEAAGPLPELPQATAIYKGTGRHWFWSRYVLVYEEDEWRILTMVDAGKEALDFSEEVLEEKMAEIVERASEQISLVEAVNIEEEEDEDEDGEDDEDEDEDEDDEELGEFFEHFEEMILITTRAMHYVDAMIKNASTNVELYSLAYDQAIAIQDNERAAAYAEMQVERFPELRGDALRKLAVMQIAMAATYEENEDEEQTMRFTMEAENNLRTSIVADGAAIGYVLLAETLIAQEKQLDEAEQLLQLVLARADVDDKEATLAEAGMGHLAEGRDDKENALHHYQRAAAISPDLPGIWFTIGSVQGELGQIKEAEQSYLRSTKETPEETRAYGELAIMYIEGKDFDAAEAILEEGLTNNPDDADLLASMALVYINKGNLRLAKEYLDEAEEIDADLDLVQVVRQLYDVKHAERRQHKQKGKSRKFKKR